MKNKTTTLHVRLPVDLRRDFLQIVARDPDTEMSLACKMRQLIREYVEGNRSRITEDQNDDPHA